MNAIILILIKPCGSQDTYAVSPVSTVDVVVCWLLNSFLMLTVTRSSGLAKTILQGTVQGGRRRGRQRKRWEDNIKEWTGLEWNTILRKAENREEWRKLVAKSTVVPQRSARLDNIREEDGKWTFSANQTISLLSQFTETGPTSPSAEPITPGTGQGSSCSTDFF